LLSVYTAFSLDLPICDVAIALFVFLQNKFAVVLLFVEDGICVCDGEEIVKISVGCSPGTLTASAPFAPPRGAGAVLVDTLEQFSRLPRTLSLRSLIRRTIKYVLIAGKDEEECVRATITERTCSIPSRNAPDTSKNS
jgi:hypothetical protein